MNYGMFGLKEGRESRLNVMKRRTSFLGKTKGRKKDEKVDMRICGGMDDDFRDGGCERGGGV